MCSVPLALTTLAAGVSAYGAYQQAEAEQEAAKYNARMANLQAQNAQRRGEEEAAKIQRQARQLAGTQRATFAARGIDISSGTPSDIIDETNFFGQVDAATARENAAWESFGYQSESAMYRNQANSISPVRAAGISLIGSAPAVAKEWERYNAGRKNTASSTAAAK